MFGIYFIKMSSGNCKPKKNNRIKLYSTKEAAERIGVSVVTLGHWVRKGYAIPYSTCGHRIKFTYKEIQRLKKKKIAKLMSWGF